MQSRLPDDHYHYIVCHVQNRKDLLSLRLTSRVLGYEATKVLYRTVELNNANKSTRPLLSYLSRNPRTSYYVERFSITFAPKLLSLRIGSGPRLIREFLCKAHNLKELSIINAGHALFSITLGEVTEGAKFSLRHLRCNLLATESCSRFLQSQPGIVDLCWLEDPVPTVTASHLPNLTTLEIGTNHELLMALLPGRKIIRLKYGLFKAPPQGTFSTIEVLRIDSWTLWGDKLSQVFPNLRYLSALCYTPQRVLSVVSSLVNLQKLVLYSDVTRTVPFQDTQFAAELCSTHPTLRRIDLCDAERFWEIERGPTKILKPSSLLDPDEWKTW